MTTMDTRVVPELIQSAVDSYSQNIASGDQKLALDVPFAMLRQAATLLSTCCEDNPAALARMVAGEFLLRLELRFRGVTNNDHVGAALRHAEKAINFEFPELH